MTTAKKSFPGLQMPANSDEWKQEALLTYAAAIESAHPLQKDQQTIMAEAGKQLMLIKYEGVKVVAVKEEMGKLHKQSTASMETVIKHHFALHEAAQGKEYQQAVDDYLKYDLDTCGKQYQQVLEVGFYNIMQIMATRLEIPKEPDVITVVQDRPPRNLIERVGRLLGGGNNG